MYYHMGDYEGGGACGHTVATIQTSGRAALIRKGEKNYNEKLTKRRGKHGLASVQWWPPDSAGSCQPTTPPLYRTPPLFGIVPILELVQRVPVVPSDFTGTIPAMPRHYGGTTTALACMHACVRHSSRSAYQEHPPLVIGSYENPRRTDGWMHQNKREIYATILYQVHTVWIQQETVTLEAAPL